MTFLDGIVACLKEELYTANYITQEAAKLSS